MALRDAFVGNDAAMSAIADSEEDDEPESSVAGDSGAANGCRLTALRGGGNNAIDSPSRGQPWAPKDTEELLEAIGTMDFGVSDDRSSKLATPAIKAYNKVADEDQRALQTRGQPLGEGFTIVKVCAYWWLLA